MSTASNIDIGYPAEWVLPLRVSPDETDRQVMEWLASVGVLDRPDSEANANASTSGSLAAYAYPFARPGITVALGSFHALWFLWDDRMEGDPTDSFSARMHAALCGAAEPRERDPVRPWWLLVRDLEQGLPEWWARRLADRFRSWMIAVGDEAELYRRKGADASFEEYLSVRVHTVGMYGAADLCEAAAGRAVPDRLYTDPHFQEMCRLLNLLEIADNDLHGITKDVRNGWLNGVEILTRERNYTWVEAARHIAQLRRSWLDRLFVVERNLEYRLGDEVRPWLSINHHALAGLMAYHHTTPRYSTSHVLPDGDALTLTVTFT